MYKTILEMCGWEAWLRLWLARDGGRYEWVGKTCASSYCVYVRFRCHSLVKITAHVQYFALV